MSLLKCLLMSLMSRCFPALAGFSRFPDLLASLLLFESNYSKLPYALVDLYALLKFFKLVRSFEALIILVLLA